jgi:RNA polymerase I-specific transcription initiation factor RRN6
MERAIPFYQLTLVSADLSVYQTVLLLSSEHDPDPESIAWRKTVIPNYNLAASDEDDFIEPTGFGGFDPQPKLGYQTPRLLFSLDRSSAERIIDNASTYEALIASDQDTITMENLIGDMQEVMKAGAIPPSLGHT